MAKGFNERERETIRQKLMDAAEACWGKYGIKKTSVDELVSMANISKGSFYLFYPSKEHLFMDTFERIDERTKEKLFSMLNNSAGSKSETFTSIIRHLFSEVQKSPWMLNANNGDLELLIRKLPPERVGNHLSMDDSATAELIKYLGVNPGIDPKLVSGVFRAVFMMLLHKDEIGADIFDDVIGYMVNAVTAKLFQDEQNQND